MNNMEAPQTICDSCKSPITTLLHFLQTGSRNPDTSTHYHLCDDCTIDVVAFITGNDDHFLDESDESDVPKATFEGEDLFRTDRSEQDE
jgi:hypothetical protein